MSFQLYWGDLHSHCSISYGHGTVEQALARARGQLDFCSITGHAFWPDMPTDRSAYAQIIDYHREGFARLAGNWNELLELQKQASQEHEFLALPSYEWHSLKYGDHNVYTPGPELPLVDAPDLPSLRKAVSSHGQTDAAILIPHHIGYAAGYRGIDWRHFHEELSPFVEIFSLHGCSESDGAPYPMLHDMGPRDAGSTASFGWSQGHKFGVVGGTDHHAAYPGSHGDGRMGIFAKSLTREDIWEALLARRVYAATGDKMDARLWVNDAWIGEELTLPERRRLKLQVHGSDELDHVEVLKNERIIGRYSPQFDSRMTSPRGRYRVRITWGWGRKDRPLPWEARLSLSGGSIVNVETCFSGQAVVAPKGKEEASPDDDVLLPHKLLERSDYGLAWRSITAGNLTMRHPATQAISLEVEAAPKSVVTVEVNGHTYRHSLEELQQIGARTHYLRGWLSEAVRIGPAVPIESCEIAAELTNEPADPTDVYRLRAAQRNGHWVWLTPVWVNR